MARIDDLAMPRVAKLYQDVPAEQFERFKGFHTRYPAEHATVDGVEWTYIDAGAGAETLLLLPGALGVADMGWEQIVDFAQRHRVIAPDYAPLKSMDALVDGIAGILEREGVERAHVLGGSYGGFVAQVFVRRHPALTASLILSHTLPPDAASGQMIQTTLSYLSLIPMFLLRRMVGNRLRALLPEKASATALTHAIFDEAVRHRMTKEVLINSYWRLVDFNQAELGPDDLADWPGQVLLMMSDDDPAIPEPVREALRATYPEAEEHVFHGTGHAAAVLQPNEYRAVIEQFITD
ncbi:MAG: alpha/beta hydrolase [Anaerolineae bacterium]|jgi:pimeloyl-ACP methyl ester carboxylesterase